MPTYQYACTACGEQHEAVQAFSDAPLTECPACGGALRKVFSAVGVVFKGSGFYKTDSRSSAKKESAGKESAGSSSGDGASTSAPAAKTESSSSAPAKTESKPSSTPAAKTA